MIVDDDSITRTTLSRLLRGEGYEAQSCDNGLAAVREAMKTSPDLIILDLMMPSPDPARCPVFDGYSALSWLKRSDKLRRIPVIILSAKPVEETKAKTLEAGAVAYFQKPCERERLLAAIQIALDEPVPPEAGPDAEGSHSEGTEASSASEGWLESGSQTHMMTRRELRQIER
jgi:CheY-like chemotaxis protein